MTINKLIKKYADQVVQSKRDDGSYYTHLIEDHDEELQEAIYKTHGDLFPHDWIYETFGAILDHLTGYTIECLEDMEEYRHEIVDGLVDIYTHDLTAWLHSSITFVYYLDEAVKEYGQADNILMMAQYMAIDEIFNEVLNLIEEGLDND